MPATYTPLRYPGGKTKLYEEIKPFLLPLGENITYVEPFAGGAGLAFKLLFCGDVQSIVLNDIDKNIYLFWRACLDQTDDFCALVENARLSIEEWDYQRSVLANPGSYSDLEVAFAVFYLNRCNRSGIIKGGPIGGRGQTGKYKIDARFNKNGLIKKIREIGNINKKVSVYCMDGKKFLNEICTTLPCATTLINIDPPYVKKGPELYQNSFNETDHIELSRVIKGLEHNWIVTYDANELIKELYSEYYVKDISLGYSAGRVRKKGREYLITNSV